jgi:hypothetical protein
MMETEMPSNPKFNADLYESCQQKDMNSNFHSKRFSGGGGIFFYNTAFVAFILEQPK